MLFNDIVELLLCIPAALIALTVHEYCHAYVAFRLGDPTARSLGRLTLNPLKHLDPIGTFLMIFLGFGYAKPVPINPRYFKNPRKGMALVAAAGPLSNFILALLAVIIFSLTNLLANAVLSIFPVPFLSTFFVILCSFFYMFHLLNLCYFIFNLIPIPPLDGSRILSLFLPPRLYFSIMKYERVISMILLVALLFGAFTNITYNLVTWISTGMFWLINLIIP